MRYPLDNLARRLGITLHASGGHPHEPARGMHPEWEWGDLWQRSAPAELTGHCTCRREARPMGRICDRCGRLLAVAKRVAA